MTVIAFSRSIGPVLLSAILHEKTESTLEITEIPVESGADITDHAYLTPRKAILEVVDRGGAITYQALARLQQSREPFTLVTGLTILRNMLVKRIDTERDAANAYILRATVELQEIILVSTAQATGSSAGGLGGAGPAARAQPAGAARAAPGANGVTGAAAPRPSTTLGAATQARAAVAVVRGDAPTTVVSPTAPANQSILRQLFG